MSLFIPEGWSRKQVARYIAAENAKHGAEFVSVDTNGRPLPDRMLRALRNRHLLVQEFAEPDHPQVLVRLSVSRTALNDKGDRWLDGITWDQLQAVKDAMGYAEHDAVEVYPRSRDVVNVAAIRHLWVLREPVPFAWGKGR